MTPDKVVDAFGQRSTKLKVMLLDSADGGIVLVQGQADDLRFLGQLLLAIAEGGDPGFHLDPRGAGAAHFDPSSPLGLYIHRTD
jgi:hypothetical protein